MKVLSCPSNRAAALSLLLTATLPSIHAFTVPQNIAAGRRIARPLSSSPQQSSSHLSMIKYEDLMEKLPSPTVVDAVDGLNEKRVVASDVAAVAGVSLSQARKDLTALASLSQGDIAVDNDGELIYQFPADLKGKLASNSAKYKTQQAIQKAWPGIFWFVRASFGITLLVSLLAIFSTILFIQSSSSSSDDRDNRRGGGMSFGGSYMWGPSPFDFLFWNRPYGYYASPAQPPPEEMGFLTSVFSYVFGDGDPNAQLEEKRLSLVANVIRENKGAVTAEQLAPFCDDAPEPEEYNDATYVDESFVLPIVTALNGEPQVTDDGEIVYTFPELQTSAQTAALASSSSSLGAAQASMTLRRAGLPSDASAGRIQQFLNWNGISTQGALERSDLLSILEGALPPPSASEQALLEDAAADARTDALQEREYKFSVAPDVNRFLAAGLGVVNLGGALYLGNLLGQYALYGVQLPSYMGLVQQGYPLLLGYAVLFNVIPAVRAVWIKGQNSKIQARNVIRNKWKAVLEGATRGGGRLGRKLKSAAKMGTRLRQLGSRKEDILFDTSKPIEDLKEKKEQQALKDFDKLLEKNSDDSNSFQ